MQLQLQDGTTALMYACGGGYTKIVEMLLEKGVDDINIKDEVVVGFVTVNGSCVKQQI